MSSIYGKAKNDIRSARKHIKSIVERIGWLEEDYADVECIKEWFRLFKPYLVQADESLIQLIDMLVDPAPYDLQLKERDNGNSTNVIPTKTRNKKHTAS